VIHHQLASESSNASQPVAQRQPASHATPASQSRNASQPVTQRQPASHATAGHVLDVEAVVPLRRPVLVQRALATVKSLQSSRAV
jgi:hypothetical protein